MLLWYKSTETSVSYFILFLELLSAFPLKSTYQLGSSINMRFARFNIMSCVTWIIKFLLVCGLAGWLVVTTHSVVLKAGCVPALRVRLVLQQRSMQASCSPHNNPALSDWWLNTHMHTPWLDCTYTVCVCARALRQPKAGSHSWAGTQQLSQPLNNMRSNIVLSSWVQL